MAGKTTPTGPTHPVPVLAVAVLLVAGLFVPAALLASDPPHWTGSPEGTAFNCTSSCHIGHTDLGNIALTQAASNVDLCLSCHRQAVAQLQISESDKAMPGVSGTSHAFDVPAVNASYGTGIPSNPEMSVRVMGGNIVCSTCHNQHQNTSANGGRARISDPKPLLRTGGTGIVTAGGAFTGAEGTWYAIKITTADTSFQWRKYTLTAGWTAWSSDTAIGTDVPLADGVTVTFGAGTHTFDERWDFYASYPFLRAALDSGTNAAGNKFCRDCHSGLVWNPADVKVHTAGVKKGHPVGMPLGGGNFDRVAPLDANGGAAGTDGNPSNDLRLDGGNVQCLTCHSVHFADSNSQTVDKSPTAP